MKTIFSHEQWTSLVRHSIPNVGIILVMAAMLFTYEAWADPSAQTAATQTTMNYQGRLVTQNGMSVSQSVNMIFRLYDMSTEGTVLWTETWNSSTSQVQVRNGLFNVVLGSITPIPTSLFTQYPTLYLGITVGSDGEMVPRELVGPSPFASSVPDGAITAYKMAPSFLKAATTSSTSVPADPANATVLTLNVAPSQTTTYLLYTFMNTETISINKRVLCQLRDDSNTRILGMTNIHPIISSNGGFVNNTAMATYTYNPGSHQFKLVCWRESSASTSAVKSAEIWAIPFSPVQ